MSLKHEEQFVILAQIANSIGARPDLAPDAKKLIEVLVNFSSSLLQELKIAQEKIRTLEQDIQELKVLIGKDSHNSHNPPSSDKKKRYPCKPATANSRKPGAQTGHKGSNLAFSSTPDLVVEHMLKGHCSSCKMLLKDIKSKEFQKRQVVDIKFITNITEHRAETGTCRCGKVHTAPFPDGIRAYVQYGEQVKALVSYFSQYQLIPFERLSEIFKDVFKMQLCEGTVQNTNVKGHLQLQSFEEDIKDILKLSSVLHADETPVKVNKERQYVHVASNSYFTLLSPHKNRSRKALEDIGVLPSFTGVVSHDSYAMYFSYNFKNALCHSHLARELTLVEEEYKKRWAHELRRYFQDLNEYLDEYRKNNTRLPADIRILLKEEFKHIIERAKRETPEWQASLGKRKTPGNLLRRIILYKKAVLGFMDDLKVPFTNNQAEQDLRMLKVKQKISGHFKSEEGLKVQSRFRSYISTVKKQGRNVLEALRYIYATKNPQYLEILSYSPE